MQQTDNGMRYRILLVAPQTALLPEVGREVAAIASQHDVNLLWDPVSESDLRREASRGGYDIIWFATHATAAGVYIGCQEGTDRYIDGPALVSYVASAGACLCVLNTCQSVGLARQVLQGTEADVICTVADPADPQQGVLDREAMRTGVLFAGQLTVRGDYREAYERSKPGSNRMYLYLENYKNMALPIAPTTRDPGTDGLTAAFWQQTLARLESSITAMRDEQQATAVNVAVLRKDLESGLAILAARLDRIERGSNRPGNGDSRPWTVRDWLLIIFALAGSAMVAAVLLTSNTR